MKKLFILFIVCICFTVGCNKEANQSLENMSLQAEIQNDISDNKSEDLYEVIPGMPNRNIRHYEAISFSEFKKWVNNPDSKKQDNGAFIELIDKWEGYSNFLIPSVTGGKLNKIFVDSNQHHINFVYTNPAIRVSIQQVEADKNREQADIYRYMKDNYDVQFGVKKSIVTAEYDVSTKTGYEYAEHSYTQESVAMKSESKECVLETRYSEKSDTEYILSFIDGGILIKIIYYDYGGEDFDMKQLEKLSFEKTTLHK